MTTEQLSEQLNSLNIEPRNTEPRTIGDVDEKVQAAVEAELKAVADTLKKGHLPGYTEAVDAAKVIEDAQTTLELLKETKKKNKGKGWKILVVSFSRVQDKHLKALGVMFPEKEFAPLVEILPAVDEKLNRTSYKWYASSDDGGSPKTVKACIDLFWASIDISFAEHLEDILATTGLHTEARSRMLIDTFVRELIYLLRRRLRMPSLLFPELTIATSANPIEVVHGTNLTVLTGSVDYCVFTQFGGHLKADGPIETSQTMIEARQSASMTAAFEAVLKLAIGENFEIFLIEAKKYGLKLRDLQPQVIAEASAAAQKSKKRAISWCLTDGVEWIFGVLYLPKAGGRWVYKAESLRLKYESRKAKNKHGKTWDEIHVVNQPLMDIFSMLVCWSTQPAQDLANLFIANQNAPSTSG